MSEGPWVHVPHRLGQIKVEAQATELTGYSLSPGGFPWPWTLHQPGLCGHLQLSQGPGLPESQGILVGQGAQARLNRRSQCWVRAHPCRLSVRCSLGLPSLPVGGNACLRKLCARCLIGVGGQRALTPQATEACTP
jgi:hypothetical protein